MQGVVATPEKASIMSRQDSSLSSRELLVRIGLSDKAPYDLLDNEPLDDLGGDVGPALTARCRSFREPHTFEVGDLVTWKPGLKDRPIPRYGQPAVVMDVLDPPIVDGERASGSTYFNEPIDVVLGLFMDSGPARDELLTWHSNGRRLQPRAREA
jgi:hypothetical protein